MIKVGDALGLSHAFPTDNISRGAETWRLHYSKQTIIAFTPWIMTMTRTMTRTMTMNHGKAAQIMDERMTIRREAE